MSFAFFAPKWNDGESDDGKTEFPRLEEGNEQIRGVRINRYVSTDRIM